MSLDFCEYPLVSLFKPSCPTPVAESTHAPLRADFPGLMEIQHRALDELATRAEMGTELALNIKHAELAVRDLMIMVQSSNIPIKDVLAASLSDFIVEARQTARGLQVLASKVHGTMDSIAAFNVHAHRTIDSAKQAAGSSSRLDDVERAVLRTFQSSLAWFASSISASILDASVASSYLDRLDERLATAHMLCSMEEFNTALALDDVLWELWTRLGGNRNKIRDLKNRASVLKNVQKYRNIAVAYVASTMQALSAVDAELSQLQDRLSAVSFENEQIPVQVQLSSIESTLRRLRDGHWNGGSGRLGLEGGQ
ncbi:hypothetical protein C8Q80DRAFT_1109023 [Daedaleopsis nitida]|nr:hypothetical protein C8Q80DRAFT_1109023 [Daedaleopsis nitida]